MNNHAENTKNHSPFIIHSSLFIALILVLLTACQSAAPDGSNGTVREQTVPVTRGTIHSTMDFVGNLEYNQSSVLTWKTKGVIEQVNVQVGDRVQKGDILAVLATDSLDPSVILAEKNMIEQSEKLEDTEESASPMMAAYSNLLQKEAALTQAKITQESLYYPRATDLELRMAWDSLATAHLNFNYAKQDYDVLVERNETWIGEEGERTVFRPSTAGRFGGFGGFGGFGVTVINGDTGSSGRERTFEAYVSAYNTYVSAFETFTWMNSEPTANDYAVAEGAVQVAQEAYDQALREYLTYQDGPRQKDIDAAKTSYDAAETAYNKRYIIAQFDGTVTSVTAVEGTYVTAGTVAIRVDDMERLFVPINIPELDVRRIAQGTAVTVKPDVESGLIHQGHVESISQATSETGDQISFGARVELDDPNPILKAGMTVQVSMETGQRENVLLVPNTALNYADGRIYVVNASDGHQIDVTLGIVNENVSEITSKNLAEGTLLKVSSLSRAAMEALGLDSADVPDMAPDGFAPPARDFQPPAAESPENSESLPENGQRTNRNGPPPSDSFGGNRDNRTPNN